MNSRKKISFFILVSFFAVGLINAQNNQLENWLSTVDGIEYQKIPHDSSLFDIAYEIMITQPLDHKNPEAGEFRQQVFLSHTDKNAPMIMDTEGYAAKNRTLELSEILNANQLVIEHRYFEDSVPDSLIWEYLTIAQSAADHHRINQLFREFYDGKWVSTGISKGGQTTIFYRYFYPEDVDVSVPYVAPLNFSDADPRIHNFLRNIADTDCRNKVLDFQKNLLIKRDSIQPLFEEYCAENDLKYTIGFDAAYEYSVLEYSFSYWQWGDGDCSKIPDEDGTAQTYFDEFDNYGIFSFIADEGTSTITPFYYQAFTEIGFYDYDITPFGDLIKYVDGSNSIFYKDDWKLTFNTELMYSVKRWLDENGNNFIYIYGELDPWTATSVELSGETNSIKIVNPNGAHWTRIKHLPDDLRETVYSNLENLLDISIN